MRVARIAVHIILLLFLTPQLSASCQATTHAGTQCSRTAVDGNGYCWQHSSKSEYQDSQQRSLDGLYSSAKSSKLPSAVYAILIIGALCLAAYGHDKYSTKKAQKAYVHRLISKTFDTNTNIGFRKKLAIDFITKVSEISIPAAASCRIWSKGGHVRVYSRGRGYINFDYQGRITKIGEQKFDEIFSKVLSISD